MKPGVFFLRNFLVTLIFFFGLFDVLYSEVRCDLRHLRYLYMLSCGQRKRSSDLGFNETFFTNMPLDFDEASQYYNEQRQYNPLLEDDELLYRIFNENGNSLNYKKSRTSFTPESPYIIINILRKKTTQSGSSIDHSEPLYIPGFPREWDIDEILESGEAKMNGRRDLDELINQCCKNPPEEACTSSTFLNACKK